MSEITDVNEDDETFNMSREEKEKIRQIIKYQKAKYLSSSSCSSTASSSSSSSYSSSSKSSSLLELMKGGSTSLRRLFDMEHTSLATHFKDYSGSPVMRPIYLWGSDTDDDDAGRGNIQRTTSWDAMKTLQWSRNDSSRAASNGSFSENRNVKPKKNVGRLVRTKSYKKLPGSYLRRFMGFGFRFRLRRLRVILCGKRIGIR
ncbi:hypothetical protein ACHQM5_014234 [Ranunculus cassubicifolius]